MGNCLSSEKPSTSDKSQSSSGRTPAASGATPQQGSEPKVGELKTNYSMNDNTSNINHNNPTNNPNDNTNSTTTNNIANPNSRKEQPGSVSTAVGPHEVPSGQQTGTSLSPLARAEGDNTQPGVSKNTGPNSNSQASDNNKANGSATANGSSSQANGAPLTTVSNNESAFPSNKVNDTGNGPEVKIILMGSGESGKSTILKQMKIIHQNGYSQDDLLMYKTTIYKNLLDCAKVIVNALEQFGIDLNVPPHTDASTSSNSDTTAVSITNEADNTPSSNLEPNPQTAVATTTSAATATNDSVPLISNEELELIKHSVISADLDSTFDPRLVVVITKLWAHPYVKEMYRTRRSQFYIMDSASYFFNNVQRIGDIEYIPNVADILRARIKTTGIYETRFQMGRLNIHMYDVGGQRSERKKWIHCFDDVTLIIFCVALSEYDQVLLEETSQNRMAESLVLFDSIINSRWFVRTSVVLFLNKIDVFTEKLEMSPLENYFTDYTGGPVVKNAAKYILWRFTKLNRNNLNIYPHITQATDTSNIRLVFAAVKETILQNSLRDSGLL